MFLMTACGADAMAHDAPIAQGGSSSSSGAVVDEGLGGSSTSTGEAPDVEGTSSSSTSGVGDESSGGSTGPEPPSVQCKVDDCSQSCSREETSGCFEPEAPEGYVECALPEPCAGLPDDLASTCVTQALRYNVPGVYTAKSLDGDALIFEVFGPAQVRAQVWSESDTGCSNAASTYHPPQQTVAADHGFWDECEGAECHSVGRVLPGLDCQPLLNACPALPPPGDDCESACPMANDGVCDGSPGTGLCKDECDMDDCADAKKP